MNSIFCFISFTNRSAGADPGFQVRGGGGGGGAYLNFLGVFRVKNHDFMPKNLIFFPILGGGGGGAPGLSPLSDALDGNFLFKQPTLETTPFHPF